MDSAYHPKTRHKIKNVGHDKKTFSNTADRTHKANMLSTGRPMRGGIRL